MKNSLKITFAALLIATSFAACDGSKDKGADTTVVDSNVTVDSTIKVDSTVHDTAKTDTAAKM